MGPRKLLIGVIVIDGVLLIILCLCLVLGISVATLEPTAPSVVELATDQPTASETLQPSPTPSITPTPTQTATPTPIPTMALVTPLPTAAIEEPTKLPYVFPSPIRIPGNTPPTPTVIGPR